MTGALEDIADPGLGGKLSSLALSSLTQKALRAARATSSNLSMTGGSVHRWRSNTSLTDAGLTYSNTTARTPDSLSVRPAGEAA